MKMQCLSCMSVAHHNPLHCLIPPYMTEKLSRSSDPKIRNIAIANLVAAAEFRTERRAQTLLAQIPSAPSAAQRKNRQVFSAGGKNTLPGKPVRVEGSPAHADPAVNEAYDYSGTTYDFYSKLFNRNSLDDAGMSLISTVHLSEAGGQPLNNAFWNGQQMAYGDGDGILFSRFTQSLDVVGHELTHGVQAFTSNLMYQGESGALNEHFADVFGILIRQWKRKESADQSDWLIGKEVLIPLKKNAEAGASRRAIRDMLNPGTAYRNDPYLGDDPQPNHYAKRYKGAADNGGVHLNSGIANRAFALTAKSLGGNAWEVAGKIWYDTMLQLSRNSGFADCARVSIQIAAAHSGAAGKAVKGAWKSVGL